MPFFSKLGFQCPEAKGDADFLQDVTIKTGQGQFRKDQSRKHDYMPVQVISPSSPSVPGLLLLSLLLLLSNPSASALYFPLHGPQHLTHLTHADGQPSMFPLYLTSLGGSLHVIGDSAFEKA